MRIDYLKIENFKGIDSLQIDFNGGNATICGQNGSGKTSVLDAVCWLLTNKFSNDKTGESANFNAPDNVTVVEMKLDSGLTLRRECNGKSLFFIHGVPYGATDYKKCVAEIFKNAVPALLTPFNFCRMHYNDRRNILLSLFAQNIQIDADFADIAEDLKTLTPSQIIKRENLNSKQIDKELAAIPARISELESSKVTVDVASINAEIDKINAQIAANSEKLKQCQSASKAKLEPFNQANIIDSEARRLEDSLTELRANYVSNEIELKKLRDEFINLQKATSGTCPTCGGKVSAANLEDIQVRLDQITAQGKELAEKQELLKKGASVSKDKAAELRQQAADLRAKFEVADAQSNTLENLQSAFLERDSLQEKLSNLKLQLADAERATENLKRIEQLKARELKLGADKTLCDKKIFLAESYIRRKIQLTEQLINDQFEFVTFKMFDSYKVSDGIKECCDPMLNGVPYYALSKGEQLKVSLDILKTLQKAFGVELPVFIDDAESYTSNSFVDLPNQIILLKATEGVTKLQINIDNANTNFERKSA